MWLNRIAWMVLALAWSIALPALPARDNDSVGEPQRPESPQPEADSLSEMLRAAILDNLRGEYEESDDWGNMKTVERYRIKGKGLDLRLEKRAKEVKHGLWKQYRVTIVDPSQSLHARIANLRYSEPGVLELQVFISARLHGLARMERWRQGVKMLNFSAEADCTVEARLDCQVAAELARSTYWRDLVIKPEVTAVGLKLVSFDLQRVSKIGGSTAHELGDGLKGTVARQLERRGPKVAMKINKSLAKRQDRFRYSPGASLSRAIGALRNFDPAGEAPGAEIDNRQIDNGQFSPVRGDP